MTDAFQSLRFRLAFCLFVCFLFLVAISCLFSTSEETLSHQNLNHLCTSKHLNIPDTSAKLHSSGLSIAHMSKQQLQGVCSRRFSASPLPAPVRKRSHEEPRRASSCRSTLHSVTVSNATQRLQRPCALHLAPGPVGWLLTGSADWFFSFPFKNRSEKVGKTVEVARLRKQLERQQQQQLGNRLAGAAFKVRCQLHGERKLIHSAEAWLAAPALLLSAAAHPSF